MYCGYNLIRLRSKGGKRKNRLSRLKGYGFACFITDVLIKVSKKLLHDLHENENENNFIAGDSNEPENPTFLQTKNQNRDVSVQAKSRIISDYILI